MFLVLLLCSTEPKVRQKTFAQKTGKVYIIHIPYSTTTNLNTVCCRKPDAMLLNTALRKLTLQAGLRTGIRTNASFESTVNKGYPGGWATCINMSQCISCCCPFCCQMCENNSMSVHNISGQTVAQGLSSCCRCKVCAVICWGSLERGRQTRIRFFIPSMPV